MQSCLVPTICRDCFIVPRHICIPSADATAAAAGFQKEWNRKFLVFASERSGVQH